MLNATQKICLLSATVFISALTALAQSPTNKLGAWYMVFGTNNVSEHYSVLTEAQFRFFDLGAQINQVLLRTGVNYGFTKQTSVTLGYAYVYGETYSNQLTSFEHRLFEQFMHRHSIDALAAEHRVRLEQRRVTMASQTDFTQRFRYRFMCNIPIADSSWFASFYNEIFLNLSSSVFDQNRLYGAIALKLNSTDSIQFGYMMNTFPTMNLHRLQVLYVFNTNI